MPPGPLMTIEGGKRKKRKRERCAHADDMTGVNWDPQKFCSSVRSGRSTESGFVTPEEDG